MFAQDYHRTDLPARVDRRLSREPAIEGRFGASVNLDRYDAPVSVQRGAEIEIVRAEQEYRTYTDEPTVDVCFANPSEKKPLSSPHWPEYLHQDRSLRCVRILVRRP